MKTLLTICALLLGIITAHAQPSNIVSAYNYLGSGELAKAEESINKATEHEKTKEKAKTWYYRGKIYHAIAEPNSAYPLEKRRQAYVEAGKSLRKAKTLDCSRIDVDDLNRRLKILNNMCLNEGVSSYNDRNYAVAASLFEESVSLAETLGIIDTLALYNVGLTHEKNQNYDKAIAAYRRCADLGYKGAEMYSFLQYCYLKIGNEEKSTSIILEGLQRYPNDQNILTSAINSFLKQGQIQEANELLTKAIKNDPDNAILYFCRGALLDALGKETAEIEQNYEKAIELNPDYFDPYYNLGALYFNQGVDINNQAAEETDNAKYEESRAEANALFKKALVPLEKAYEIDPANRSTMESLLALYAQLNMIDEYNDINQKLGR